MSAKVNINPTLCDFYKNLNFSLAILFLVPGLHAFLVTHVPANGAQVRLIKFRIL